MNTADILDKAADLIEQRGHHKGWYCGPAGTLCAAGALYAAAGIEPGPEYVPLGDWPGYSYEIERATSTAWVKLSNEIGVGRAVGSWNDNPRRTKEEVVSTLRAAAQAARAEQ